MIMMGPVSSSECECAGRYWLIFGSISRASVSRVERKLIVPVAHRQVACRRYRYPVPIFRVQYEWDNGKGADNLRKHGVDFADAIAALEDPNRVEEMDTRFVYGEELGFR